MYNFIPTFYLGTTQYTPNMCNDVDGNRMTPFVVQAKDFEEAAEKARIWLIEENPTGPHWEPDQVLLIKQNSNPREFKTIQYGPKKK